ncbi:MAG: thioredoxin domain-containing protein [Acidobacteria bacterium]|nr:thioredoxin domain-containing protein [Acidobacteriota bacterium]
MKNASVCVRRGSVCAFAALLAVSILATGCDAGVTAEPAPGRAPRVQSAATVTGVDEVLATIDGVEITLGDLVEQIGQQLGQMDFQYRSQRHQVIETAMKQFVRDKLVESEAEARGVTVDALVAELLGDQVDVTDDDVRFFYIQNQANLDGQSFEAIASQIRDYLESQIRDSVLEGFAEDLAADHDVDYVLDPFRVDIETAGSPLFGSVAAPITLIEFSDFECPYCKSFMPTLEQIKAEYADQVKIVFKQFPLNQIHPQAQKAAEASLCAHEQGKFWETHDLYFAEQDRLEIADLEEKAGRLDLDTAAFSACLASGKYVDVITADTSDGAAVGVNGTPAIFINGRPLPGGAVPFETLAEMIDDELERLRR